MLLENNLIKSNEIEIATIIMNHFFIITKNLKSSKNVLQKTAAMDKG